ncbi:acyltransferase family protein [Bacillus spongiae]|uniref:Acyltransferase family protein n=1 Tax=Bacillus spongiae TaxID=2683610 RepID=A0ABU8HBE8_9BACI
MRKDIKLSNMKGMLVFLVVFGHFIELNKENYYQIFVFIYTFHMPLFVFISGFLAKRMKVKKVINLIILYIIFQTACNFYFFLTGDSQLFKFNYDKPIFHLWYLVSMVFWYILAGIVGRLKLNNSGKILLLMFIIIISFFSRWYTDAIVDFMREFYPNFSSYTFSYQRTITFSPFFFAGLFMSREMLKQLYTTISTNKAKALLVVTAATVFLINEIIPNMEWLYKGSYGTYRFLAEDQSYLLKMILHFALSAWICLLILNVINEKKSIFTKWGDNSLGIFLMHPIFIFPLRHSDFMDKWNVDTQLLVIFIMSIIVTSILGSDFFSQKSRFITSPMITLEKLIRMLKDLYNTKVTIDRKRLSKIKP